MRRVLCATICCSLMGVLGCQQENTTDPSTEMSDSDTTTTGVPPSSVADGKGAPTLTPSNSSVDMEETRFPDGPTRPLPTLHLEPVDLTTSVGGSPLHVLISNLGAPVGIGVLNQIAASVTLRTWPELELVPTSVSKISDVSGKSDEDQFAHIYLEPVSPLADRWYALHVDVLPSGTATWSAFPHVWSLTNGSRVSRFRTGSEPVVASVRVYQKEENAQVAYIDFSERIVGDLRMIQLSDVEGRSSCRVASSSNGLIGADDGSSGISPLPGEKVDNSIVSAVLTCPNALDLKQTLHLDIQPGLRSNSGPPLNGGRSVRITIEPTTWVDWGDSGKAFKPVGL